VSTPESLQPGPCTPWIVAEDVAAVCDAIDSTDPSVYDTAALQASQVLYELSGRQFSGECGPVTVRPCRGGCVCWVPGRTIDWQGWGNCRCGHLSRVKLAGWPVREITEVKIDGDVIDPSEYRLDGRKWLTRMVDADGKHQRWPGCQDLDRPDTVERTFAVSYTFGQDPPQAGLDAAAEFACAVAPAIASGGGECALPPGTVRVTRQGVEIDLAGLRSQRTGLPSVDSFLSVYNPSGLRRRSAIFSPDIAPFAQRVG
jgi:hypothetical protein